MKKKDLLIGAVAAGIIYALIKRKEQEDTDGSAEDLKENLLQNQEVFSELTMTNVLDWFERNRKDFSKDAEMCILRVTQEVAEQYGTGNDEIDFDHYLIQLFRDPESEKILRVRYVNFDRMDEDLKKELEENDGFIKLEG